MFFVLCYLIYLIYMARIGTIVLSLLSRYPEITLIEAV